MKIDRRAIRDLAEILEETGLTEIEVAEGDAKIRVSRAVSTTVASAPMMSTFPMGDPGAPQRPNLEPVAAVPAADRAGAVKSPMVGTAYMSPEPGATPFAPVGKAVKAGDTLLIIEAMKVMNPIKAEKAGVVQEVLVTDGQPVEYGDVLVVIA